MDEYIINLIRNRISNDYCKLMCDEIIEEKSKLIMESYIIWLMIYCMIYDIPYFVEYIYKENTQNMEESLLSDKVYETVMSKKCVDIHDRLTPLDFWVYIIAFTFDLNFDITYKVVKENECFK